MGWTACVAALADLAPDTRAALERILPSRVPRGAVLFRPGEASLGYVIVLDGMIEVFLTGATGRTLKLYDVDPGGACVQSTLGLLGGGPYTGEAVAATDSEVVVIPADRFDRLLATAPGFRRSVFAMLARRLQDTMQTLEALTFDSVEARLVRHLLATARDGVVEATHAELAVAIGSAREVVSRQLEKLEARGLVRMARGRVELIDANALSAAGGLMRRPAVG